MTVHTGILFQFGNLMTLIGVLEPAGAVMGFFSLLPCSDWL